MSIQAQIDRLETARSDIKTALENKGVPVSSETKIDGMAALLSGAAYVVNVSSDTVTEDNLAAGVTAHDAAGNPITGTAAAYVSDGILYLPFGVINGNALEV